MIIETNKTKHQPLNDSNENDEIKRIMKIISYDNTNTPTKILNLDLRTGLREFGVSVRPKE